MDICLITAPTIAEFTDSVEITTEPVVQAAGEPQLGVLSLAAVLEARGVSLQVCDLNRTYLGFKTSDQVPQDEDFAEAAAFDLASRHANVYGFSSICSSYPLTLRIARRLKAIRPESLILLGGPQASVVDMQTLSAFPFVDFILRGEAEQTLPLLLNQLNNEQHLDQVPGLSYHIGDQPCRNPNAPVIANLDELPFPAYHVTEDLRGRDRAALELGRGCPFACTFCSTNDFFRRNFRLRSPQLVLRDMRRIAATYSIRHFQLVHDMFTVDKRRVAEFCEAMIASDDKFTWGCSARTDCVDEQLLALMARAGCRGIFFGVESGSERIQNIIDKHLDPKRAEEIIDEVERLGISTTVALIAGFPEETLDDLRQTIRIFMHSARCPKSQPQLNLLAPLASTPIYSKYKNELILEELCSGMSHQARSNDDEDFQLVRSYPGIFPNFYSIPTRHLERAALVELQEFALMATACFRWLLTAIDQATNGTLGFFLEWRTFRLKLRPSLHGPDLRGYYRAEAFRSEFLSFVKSQDVAHNPAVDALLSYENTMRQIAAARKRKATTPTGQLVPQGAALRLFDKPLTKDGVCVVGLNFDIQGMIDALKLRTKPVLDSGPRYYITRGVSSGLDRLDRVSNWLAYLLGLCDGRRRIEEIVQLLSPRLADIEDSHRAYVCMRLLAGAQAQNLIDIYRTSLAKKQSFSTRRRMGASSERAPSPGR